MENQELVLHKDESMFVFGSKENFENAQRMARVLSSSNIVPQSYQGEKGLPNCIIALEMANRIGMTPMAVMQNLYVVHGNPGWSSKFLIAALNACGKFTPIRYEFKGEEGSDDWGCRAWAMDRTGEKLCGAWVTIKMAKDEGWYGKNGSKWKTMPELMLQYRAGAFFQRTYAPEIGMGLQTAEELHDIGRQVIDIDYSEIEKVDPSTITSEQQAKEEVLKGSITKEEADKVVERLREEAGKVAEKPKEKTPGEHFIETNAFGINDLKAPKDEIFPEQPGVV